MTNFENLGLAPEILKAVIDLGFETPMPVQEKVIPLILENDSDVVALAQTGTGKTAAFGLPLIQRTEAKDKSIQALILCPTRELCLQISDDLNSYSKYLPDLHVLPVYGGSSIEVQIRAMKKGVQIVVATPGRMLDLIGRKVAKLNSVKTVVLDEADEMLNMGFIESLNEILKSVPEERRTLLFSATMPNEVASIARNYMQNPEEVTIGTRNSGAENVRHLCYTVSNKDRYAALKRVADFNPNIYGIVFCRTRRETQEVADMLIKDGYNADALHGDLSQAQRDYVMQKFRVGNIRLLVATDVAARGLDVSDLSHIINYNLPDDFEIYNHRSGRTGRAGKKGTSVIIAGLKDKSKIKKIEKSINKKFEYVDVPKGREICERQLLNLIDRMERVEVDNSQLDSFLPVIFKKLEWLDKEDIIRRFASLEFNRFLNYYRDAADIGSAVEGDDREGKRKKDKGKKSDKRDRFDEEKFVNDEEKSSRKAEKGFVRLHLNVGKKDGVFPNVLIELINQTEPEKKIKIGRIDLTKKDTYFEVKADHAKGLLKKLSNVYYMDRRVKVDVVG
ncbi:MAG: DEAD/DEAH box helicase [Prevotellaceae bacterium]|jgi:ATP-dependent RNA helicase DeaD|nr:DEAD/DEAH box helicase [Prevotellaceae bacterium]